MLLMSFSVFNGFELFELNDEATSKASYTLSFIKRRPDVSFISSNGNTRTSSVSHKVTEHLGICAGCVNSILFGKLS